MKKIFSKKSGFTLVEIVVAFAVFAIMAAMILQVIHLTINSQKSNREYEQNLAEQEEKLITNGKFQEYDVTKKEATPIELNFEGMTTPMKVDYNIRDVEGNIGEKGGINYIVGNVDYSAKGGSTAGDDVINGSKKGAQKDRFDTRITGTTGISQVTINVSPGSNSKEYKIKVTISDSSVDNAYKKHSQISLFFGGDPTTGDGTLAEVDKVTPTNGYKVQKSGKYGVNVHCNSASGFAGNTVEFTLTLKNEIPGGLTADSFGDNGAGVYGPYTVTKDGKTTTYVNIFGAYPKSADTPDPTT